MTEMYQETENRAMTEMGYWGISNADAERIAQEEAAAAAVEAFARRNQKLLRAIWGWGDGGGGGLLEIIAKEIGLPSAHEQAVRRPKPSYVKAVIPASVRTQVFERDSYRCVICGGFKGLACDHIFPESKGGETTFENLQTLCKSCNSKKGAKA